MTDTPKSKKKLPSLRSILTPAIVVASPQLKTTLDRKRAGVQ